MHSRFFFRLLILFAVALSPNHSVASNWKPRVVVLGVAQDGGKPHALCEKDCCREAFADNAQRKRVSCVGIIDPITQKCWLIDATPDLPAQLHELQRTWYHIDEPFKLAGIFLTHGHVGHYTGLMFLGREVAGTNSVPVYVMPRMKKFLETSGPWNQLVRLKNVELVEIHDDTPVKITDKLSVTPFLVPHRDEYTETVGYRIEGPNAKAVYIPDIDKWSKWDRKIEDIIDGVDIAFVDGTFYTADELPGRDMSEIPHPFVVETVMRFSKFPERIRRRIIFIHLNHSNPLWDPNHPARTEIESMGFRFATRGFARNI